MRINRKAGSVRGFTLIELVFVVLVLAVLGALLLLAVRRSPAAARRTQCLNNLHNIALASHNYAGAHGGFPPAYTVDEDGNRLHSWRTLLLPYLDEQALYASIDLSKPWDDPINAKARESALAVFRCPEGGAAANHTTYLACVGTDLCLKPTERRPISEITDGLGQTVVVIEAPADRAVPWMSPHDADLALFLSISEKSQLAHPGLFTVAFADGRVRPISALLPEATRRALMSVAGGDEVSDSDY